MMNITIDHGGPICPEKFVIRINGNVHRSESAAPEVFGTHAEAARRAEILSGSFDQGGDE